MANLDDIEFLTQAVETMRCAQLLSGLENEDFESPDHKWTVQVGKQCLGSQGNNSSLSACY